VVNADDEIEYDGGEWNRVRGSVQSDTTNVVNTDDDEEWSRVRGSVESDLTNVNIDGRVR